LAALLALAGVGVLELGGSGVALGWGDLWAVLAGLGFAVAYELTEEMMAREPTQALAITAAQIGVCALSAVAWALVDGTVLPGTPHGAWLLDEATRQSFTLPGLLTAGNAMSVAVLWTGLVSTAACFCLETVALGRLSSSEATVLLATEPLWAAMFAAGAIGESLSVQAGCGGALIVAACVVSGADLAWLRQRLGALSGSTPSSEPILPDLGSSF
jgi:drug/metabolite transporter (DMT)-like permease